MANHHDRLRWSALLLAIVGIYAVVSYSVEPRTGRSASFTRSDLARLHTERKTRHFRCNILLPAILAVPFPYQKHYDLKRIVPRAAAQIAAKCPAQTRATTTAANDLSAPETAISPRRDHRKSSPNRSGYWQISAQLF
jgi:hypothetical protein